MVLEDDPALRFALTQILEEGGHKTYPTSNISGAVSILDATTLDLLMLDLMIGSEDSIQVADLAGYRTPDAEIVYLTGSNRFPDGELFRLSGNTSWVLRKPLDFIQLKSLLTHLDDTLGASLTSVSSLARFQV